MSYIQAFIALIGLVNELLAWAKQLQSENKAAEIAELGQAFTQLRASKTSEDRKNAAKALQGVISKL